MKRLIGFSLTAILLSGCAAHMIEHHGDSVQLLAPRNQKQTRGGVMKYLNTGLDSWKKARRVDAEKKMKQFCEGPYEIVAEGPRSQFGADMPIGKSVSLEVDQYTYVKFECLQ